MIEIKVGQIWQVIDDEFWSSERSDSSHKLREEYEKRTIMINLKRGELIEIRYPTEWHYRTIDNLYLHSEPIDILKHCRLYGIINEDIRFNNRLKLKEILEQRVYKTVWESEGG